MAAGIREWETFRGETGIAEMIQDLNTMRIRHTALVRLITYVINFRGTWQYYQLLRISILCIIPHRYISGSH